MKLEKENVIVKETAVQKDKEIRVIQDHINNEKRREQICIEKREQLLQMIEEMNGKSLALENQHQQMEKQLVEFIEENERISRTLYDRDLEAERKRDRNRQILAQSQNNLRNSKSPVRRGW